MENLVRHHNLNSVNTMYITHIRNVFKDSVNFPSANQFYVQGSSHVK